MCPEGESTAVAKPEDGEGFKTPQLEATQVSPARGYGGAAPQGRCADGGMAG